LTGIDEMHCASGVAEQSVILNDTIVLPRRSDTVAEKHHGITIAQRKVRVSPVHQCANDEQQNQARLHRF
jgi:hypothetical protein